MNRLIVVLTAILLTGFTSGTQATEYETLAYVGGNVAAMEYHSNIVAEDLSLPAVYGRFGALFGKNVSFEWRAGTGTKDDQLITENGLMTANIDMFYGVYFRAGFSLARMVYPYVIGGYTRREMEFSNASLSYDSKKSDLSFGAGLDISITGDLKLNIEYMRYLKEDGVELSAPSLGLAYYY